MKYMVLFLEGFKISLMRYIIYRINFILMWIQNLVHITFTLLSMEFTYYFVDSIMGWNKYEMIILISTTQIINALYRGIIRPNHHRFTSSIRDGTFDFMLLKPVRPIFTMNFGYFDFSSLLGMILPTIVICRYLPIIQNELTWRNVIMYIVLICNGTIVISLFMFLVYCMSFIFIRVDRFEEIYYTLMSIVEKPREVYDSVLSRESMVMILPLMTIASISVELLLGKTNSVSSIWCFGSTIFLIAASVITLKTVMKKYQGASS